jgi:hypothetical protein
MSLVNTIAKLFEIRPGVLKPEFEGLKGICTEQVRKTVLLPQNETKLNVCLVGRTIRSESALERRFLRPRSGNPDFFDSI